MPLRKEVHWQATHHSQGQMWHVRTLPCEVPTGPACPPAGRCCPPQSPALCLGGGGELAPELEGSQHGRPGVGSGNPDARSQDVVAVSKVPSPSCAVVGVGVCGRHWLSVEAAGLRPPGGPASCLPASVLLVGPWGQPDPMGAPATCICLLDTGVLVRSSWSLRCPLRHKLPGGLPEAE